MAMASRKPVSDAFLPSGGMDTGFSGYGVSGSASNAMPPSTAPPQHQTHANLNANANANAGTGVNQWPITSPSQQLYLPGSNHFHGYPPSTLPPLNENCLVAPQPRNFRSVSASGVVQGSTAGLPNAYFQAYPTHQHHRDIRASSLSPTKNTRQYPLPTSHTDRALSLPPPDVHGASYLYRSVSADATADSPPASTYLIQRLTQQNASIREAWEAERNYLEANRRRAEEVYQEERVIMEEVREGWDSEKAMLLLEIQTLKDKIHRLEGENASLKAIISQTVGMSGVVSPLPSQRGGSIDTASDAPSSSAKSGEPAHGLPKVSSRQVGVSKPDFKADLASLPPGLDGASRRPHHAGPGSSRTSPVGQPESSPFIPLDPRMQTQSANHKDFLASPSEGISTPIPVIDVQEIDPKLEGIPIKATAVQKPTFGKGDSNRPSPAQSPPSVTEVPSTDEARPSVVKRGSSKDHTIQVLHAEESKRLTMHAGHTPNHSLSLFPTMSVADGSTGNGQDEVATPTAAGTEPDLGDDKTTSDLDEPDVGMAEHKDVQDVAVGDEEPEEFQVAEDPKLKGPLMIKNIPAQDELFWDQVNKKLEPISHGQNALPTVMRTSLSEHEAPANANAALHAATVGGDASQDAQGVGEGSDLDGENKKDVEGALPLKLKTTTNFGAPFGVA